MHSSSRNQNAAHDSDGNLLIPSSMACQKTQSRKDPSCSPFYSTLPSTVTIWNLGVNLG